MNDRDAQNSKEEAITLSTFARIFILLVLFCLPATAQELVIEGTGDSQFVLKQLAGLFAQDHPGARVLVPDSVGSGGGIKKLIQGKTGLASTARPLREKEKGHGFVQIPFALSPVVFAASPQGVVGVKNLSLSQILDMYSGNIANWSRIGGPDHKLFLVNREAGDSSRKVIDNHLKSVPGLDRRLGFGGKTFYTTPEAAQAVALNRYTIGYLPFSTALEKGLHLFKIEGISPDQQSIKAGRYPFITTFFLVRPENPAPSARQFLAFISTAPAKKRMLELGVFPIE